MFVFVSTNMQRFFVSNVKPMLRNCYQNVTKSIVNLTLS